MKSNSCRRALESMTGISGKLLLKGINRPDLARVKGVGEEYVDLLELAGVDTMPALARRNDENLRRKLAEATETWCNVPAAPEVAKWVAIAKIEPVLLRIGRNPPNRLLCRLKEIERPRGRNCEEPDELHARIFRLHRRISL